MSTVPAPMATAMSMPWPWAPGALVVMKPARSGLYSTTMSRLAPKPPVARMTALALTVTAAPFLSVAAMPTAAPLASVRISLAVVFMMNSTPSSSHLAWSRGIM